MPSTQGATSGVSQQGISIGRKILKGSAWSVATRLLERSIGLVSTLVLARILAPHDYGLVAMATSVAAIVEAVSAFGFEWALIQRQKDTPDYLNTAWTLNAILAVGKAALLLAVAPFAVSFYGDPQVAPMLWALAFSMAVSGLRNIGMVRCEFTMDFRPIFALTVSRKCASLAVAVTVALNHGGHWALVCGIVAGSLTDSALSYFWQPYRPRWGLERWRELFGFSKWMLLNNLLLAVNSRAADLILGKSMGTSAVGTYSVAKELGSLPTTELATPIMRAFFPGYAKLSNDRAMLSAEFRRAFGLISLVFIPIAVGLACLAEPLVHLMLGPKWVETIPLIRIVALTGAIHVVQSNFWPVYMALGKPRVMFVWGFIGGAIFMPLFWAATRSGGLVYGAYAALAVAILMGVGNVLFLSRLLGLRAGQSLVPLVRPVIASSLMAYAVVAMAGLLPEAVDAGGHALRALVLIPTGVVAYASVVVALWFAAGRPSSGERNLLEFVRHSLSAARSAR